MLFKISEKDLRYQSCVAVCSALWNQCNVTRDIKDVLFLSRNYKPWTEIEEKIEKDIEHMEVPDSLKLKLTNFIQPLGAQILEFISITRELFLAHSDPLINLNFVWTGKATLDFTKTAELIICSNPSPMYVDLCFCIACTFCIESAIFMLKDTVLPYYSNTYGSNFSVLGFLLVQYWVYKLSQQPTTKCDISEYSVMFYSLVDMKCVPVLNYFFERISDEKRDTKVNLFLIDMLQKSRPTAGNLLVYLFSLAKENRKETFLTESAYKVLSCLLEWPCFELFMPVAYFSWEYLSKPDYMNLILDIAEFISKFHMCSDYRKLIVQFWQASPIVFKQYIFLKCRTGSFLSRLFVSVYNDDIIARILAECTSEEKQMIIMHHESFNICDLLVKEQRWDSLKMFIKTCIPSVEELRHFIKTYKGFEASYHSFNTRLRTNVLIEKIELWY